jgi:choline-sulfatase
MDEIELTDADVRAARRAYYGAVSYVDFQVGRLVEVLRVTGRLDNTVIVVTSDHGEMLGERGLWYKMSFYEGSARVPLLVHAPALFPPGRVASPVSTLDLLPTLVELAEGAGASSLTGPLDGVSLVPLLSSAAAGSGDPDHGDRTVAAEYLAEGAVAPVVMLRRDRWKYIHSPGDPDLLFDVEADPDEQHDLAADDDHAELLASFATEVAGRWDLERLDRDVRQSQRRRRTVTSALEQGQPVDWDFAPPYDAARAYIRNHLDLGQLEERARYPRVRRPATVSDV